MKTRKKKKDTEIERLEREIRELRVLNRSLLKRIKKLDKGFKNEDNEMEFEINEKLPHFTDNAKKSCPECHKRTLILVSIAGRNFERCPTCDYRGKAKKT